MSSLVPEARRLAGPLFTAAMRLGWLACALLVLAGAALGDPPKLLRDTTDVMPPSEVQPGQTYTLSIHYQQANGDPPAKLVLVVDPPSGPEETIQTTTPAGDALNSFPAEFDWTPAQTGVYRLHFETASKVEPNVVTRYPLSTDFEVGSATIAQKIIELLVLLAVTLLLLPYLVFMGIRTINKNADPDATARTALLVGAVASYAAYAYLFYTMSGPLMVILVGIAAVAVLAVLIVRRR